MRHETRAIRIADVWERISGSPLWHAAGCRCSGGPGCVLVNLASTEIDLLESLANHARANNDPSAAELILRRLGRGREGSDPAPFSEWIRSLPDSGLSDASVDGILSNIERFVDSVAPLPPRSESRLGDIS